MTLSTNELQTNTQQIKTKKKGRKPEKAAKAEASPAEQVIKYLALIVTPEQTCPPIKYGGNEKQADIIVRKLLDRGIAVDLFCGPGSTCPATRVHMTSKPSMSCEIEFMQEIDRLSRKNFQYDCIIDMTGHHLIGQLPNIPVISIMTGDPYKKYPHDSVRNRVYISKGLANHFECPTHPTISNVIAIDSEAIPLGSGSGSCALYVGAIRPEKGIHIAAEACNKLQMKLKVAGPRRQQNEDYLQQLLALKNVEYIGEIGSSSPEKWKLFGDASVFLYLVSWAEAAGLAPLESMLVGTPVVASNRGGLPENVQNGKGGVIIEPTAELAAAAIKKARTMDRRSIRKHVLPIIYPDKYIDRLLSLCERASNESW